MRQRFPACVLALLTGCSAVGQRTEVCRPPLAPPPCTRGTVFVANGSGDFQTVTTNLTRAVTDTATPLCIETFDWSHGYGRYVIDHTDHANHLAQGGRLAARVAAFRQANPGQHVYLIGHSAGCAVVLAAAEALPPGQVDRVVLLAPSVCTAYDLRRALRAVPGGIDVFYSHEDRWILGLGMRMVGTAEGCCRTAAGQYGFTPILAGPEDAALYGRLRQHPWDPSVEASGNRGGHYGSNRADFLRLYVLPLLDGP